MNSRFALVALFLVGTMALHLEHQQAINTSTTTMQDVLDDLTGFQQEVAANTNYSNSLTDNKDFVQFLERTLSSELFDLYALQQDLIPTIGISPKTCSNLSETERAGLIKNLECALGKLTNLTDYLEKLSNATNKEDLYRRASLQYSYL